MEFNTQKTKERLDPRATQVEEIDTKMKAEPPERGESASPPRRSQTTHKNDRATHDESVLSVRRMTRRNSSQEIRSEESVEKTGSGAEEVEDGTEEKAASKELVRRMKQLDKLKKDFKNAVNYISRLEVDLKDAQKAKKYAVDKREEALRQIKDLKERMNEEMDRSKRELTTTLERVNAYMQKAQATEKQIREKDQVILQRSKENNFLQTKVAQQQSTNESLNRKVGDARI